MLRGLADSSCIPIYLLKEQQDVFGLVKTMIEAKLEQELTSENCDLAIVAYGRALKP